MRIILICMTVLVIAGGWACGGGNGEGAEDAVVDQPVDNPQPDVSPDTVEDQEEVIPPTPVKACASTCSQPEDCCLFAATCGHYPDRWTCDGHCELAGCADDTECQNFATTRGYPNPELFKCRTRGGGVPRCVAGCTTEADCCPASTDCSAYPNRYVCDGGNCFVDACNGDAECVTYATAQSLHRADSYVCRQSGGEGLNVCILSCAADADCCAPVEEPCAALPFHYACSDGLCYSTCSSDTECQDYATTLGLPTPANYRCY
jgi:hypothetical protein